MIKQIAFFLTMSFMALTVSAQVTAVSPADEAIRLNIAKQPSIALEDMLSLKETEFNFGKIAQGKPVTHIFEVINQGNDSLRIVNVQASCGCTTPTWNKDKVPAPGEKIDITVGYNAASEGIFTKQITIVYNGTHSKLITIKGEVWKTPTTSAPENNNLLNIKD